MEKKYQEFLKYDWKNSEEYKNYINQKVYISPPITGDKILKAKKKFYKLKVDPEFDINYVYEEPNKRRDNKSNKKISLTQHFFCAIEGVLWCTYFMNLLMPKYILNVSIIVVAMRFLRINFFNFFNLEFYSKQIILCDEYFHLLIYGFLLKLDKINYFNLFPFTCTAVFCISEYLVEYLRIFQFMKTYFTKIVEHKEKVFHARGFSYIIIGILLVPRILIGWTPFYNGIIYSVFLIYLFYYEKYVTISFQKIKNKSLKKN